MKEKEFIIILQYESGEVFVSEYDSENINSYEEYYKILNEKHDLNITEHNSNCMVIAGELNLKIL